MVLPSALQYNSTSTHVQRQPLFPFFPKRECYNLPGKGGHTYVEVNHGKATGHWTMGTHGLASSGFSVQQKLGNYVRLLAHLEVVGSLCYT